MERLRTLARIAGAAVAFLVYVWFAAVRSAGEAKRRRALRRRAIRQAASRRRGGG